MQQLHRLVAPVQIAFAVSACSDVLDQVNPANTFALTTVERSHLEAQLRAIVPALEAHGHPAADIMAQYGPEVASLTSQATAVSIDGSGNLTHNAVGVELTVINRDGADWSRMRHAFDFALDTVPYKHDLNRLIPLLKRDATYCRVGVGKVVDSNEIGQMNLVLYRNAFAGSNTGGIAETQQMLDFCGEHGITADIEAAQTERFRGGLVARGYRPSWRVLE